MLTLSGNSEDDGHPYAYARVLGIFHVDVRHRGPLSTTAQTHRMNFLWVRWFELDRGHVGGWKARRLHRIHFVSAMSPSAFGFLDPSEVIRACHLIPAFAYDTTPLYLGPSIARVRTKDRRLRDRDWRFLYVNM